ncbi:hypothetical protein MC885_019856, partial [Smutsia gigantea]
CRRSSAPPEGGEARRALGGAGGPRTAACAEVRPSRRGRRAGTQPSQLGLSAGRPPPPPGQSPALRYPRRAGSTVITPPRPRLSPFCTHIRAGGTDTPGPDPDPTRSDWESQLKLKASTPAQDILEENSSCDMHVGLGLDLKMQSRPKMGERGTPLLSEAQPALQESPWSSGCTGLKAAVQIQRPVPMLGLPNPWTAGQPALPAWNSTWLQEESTEAVAMVPGVLPTCLQVSKKSLLLLVLA